MMNIVIVGAGDLGRHVATVLSKEKHNVILLDKDAKLLQEISGTIDVAIRQGSGTDWQLLEDLLELSPDLFLALTGTEETNLVACTIAKHLGYPRTIARIRDHRYLNRTRLDFGRIFDIDYFIGPEILVASDILKYIISPDSLAVENFAHGTLQLRTIKIPDNWYAHDVSLKTLELPSNVLVGLICRETLAKKQIIEKKVIFPHGNDSIYAGDEVTFIGRTDAISEIHRLFGIPQKTIKSITLAGGSLTAFNLARLLEDYPIDVRIIEKDYDRCCLLAELLSHATIMHHDATDIDFLHAERIGHSDLLIACTNNDEVNILCALLGKEVGCDDVLVMLSNVNYISIAAKLGLRHVVSPRICATNHILSQLISGKVISLVSLYENQAEIMEINISTNSRVVGIPLSDLGPYLPRDLLIVMIQNRGRIMMANGNRIISPGDTVIVVSSPKHMNDLGKIF